MRVKYSWNVCHFVCISFFISVFFSLGQAFLGRSKGVLKTLSNIYDRPFGWK